MANIRHSSINVKRDINEIFERMKKEFVLGLKSELLPDELEYMKK